MKGLIFAGSASICAALSNFYFRRSLTTSSNDNSYGYLIFYFLFSLIFALFCFPRIWTVVPNLPIIAIGGSVGFLNVLLLLAMTKALKHGPAGLTFAFQNAASVFPGMVLFLAFGTSFGFIVTPAQIIGVLLVLAGLFWGVKRKNSESISSKWLWYALISLTIQIFTLTLIQGRCILFECAKLQGFLSSFGISKEEDVWFMPAQFGTALLVQLAIFFKKRARFEKSAMRFGSLAGLTNGSTTCLLLLATKLAAPFEKTLLFPCYAVITILLCNLWAKKFYQEEFNFTSNAICVTGVVIGSIV